MTSLRHVPAGYSIVNATNIFSSCRAMHVSGLEDILLYIASSEEERNLSMHMLEIISLMFREQVGA